MTLSEQQKKEIIEQQTQKNTTKRVTSPELEKILYEAIPVLDHGFVRVVDYLFCLHGRGYQTIKPRY